MFSLIEILNSIVGLLLPHTCCACNIKLQPWEEQICALCLMEIPLSDHHLDQENAVAQTFWGRVRLEQAGSYFLFYKASRFQIILHRLKYEHRPEIGVGLGRLFGARLLHSGAYLLPDVIVPVPLHRQRLRKRGYNQSERIAKGLALSLDRPLRTDLLLRKAKTQTQTRKSRADRYQNVQGKFHTPRPDELVNLHMLLVDDVITTGATIEACAEELLKIEGVRVSVVSLAFATKWQ